jgi:hypothetical protein
LLHFALVIRLSLRASDARKRRIVQASLTAVADTASTGIRERREFL